MVAIKGINANDFNDLERSFNVECISRVLFDMHNGCNILVSVSEVTPH